VAGAFGVSAVRHAAKGYKDVIDHVTTLGHLPKATIVLGIAWTSRRASTFSAQVMCKIDSFNNIILLFSYFNYFLIRYEPLLFATLAGPEHLL